MNKRWWQFWKKDAAYNTLRLLVAQTGGNFTAYNFAVFVEEGYQRNPTVYACVQEYVKAVQACPIIIKRKDGSTMPLDANKSLAKLLTQPNNTQSLAQFLEQAVIYYLISGEAPIYGDSIIPNRLPQELWVLRPDWLTAIESQNQFAKVEKWMYTASNGEKSQYNIPPSNLFMWCAQNPLNRYRGQSPLLPAAYAVDQLNAYAHSNKKLLDNDMQPAGSLSTDANLDESAFERMREQFGAEYAGVNNQRKPLILEGGLKWTPFSFTMRDAEFIQGKVSAKRDICEALDVPSQLLGLEGSQTYANYEQARASFYEDSAIPLYNNLLSGLSKWLLWRAGLSPDDIMCVDIDAVAALEPRRAERNAKLDTMQSISTNEKREAMGYEPVDGGDVLLVNSGLIPLEMAGADIPNLNPMF